MTTKQLHDDIRISVHLESDIEMTVYDVWPDGDMPDAVTASEVVELMEQTGSKRRMLEQWGLIGDIEIDVSVHRPNPAYRQDENLLGDPPLPRFLYENVRAWEPR